MVLSIISIVVNAILSIITIIVAVKAFKQGNKQIELSNKQSLFKDRVRAYNLLSGLFDIYENNKELLYDAEEYPAFIFHLLNNNKFLSDSIELIEKPLSSKEQNIFLSKMEDLRALATEISLLWENEESVLACCFLLEYVQILTSLYKQHIVVNRLETDKRLSLDEFKKRVRKFSERTGINKSIEDMSKVYEEMKNRNVLNVLKEQIKLK